MGGIFTNIHFPAKYKSGKANVVADALSRRHLFLGVFEAKVLGFEWIKESYEADEDFKEVYAACKDGVHGFYVQVEGLLFKGNKLCIPMSSWSHGDSKDLRDTSRSFSLAMDVSSCLQGLEALFNMSASKNDISQRVIQTTSSS